MATRAKEVFIVVEVCWVMMDVCVCGGGVKRMVEGEKRKKKKER